MKVKFLFISFLVIVIVVLIAGFRFLRISPTEYISCRQNGGEYKMVPGPNFLGFYCYQEYTDGGKKCTNSDECEGYCLVTEDTQLDETDSIIIRKVIGGYGKCEANNEITGCFPGTMESPTASCS